MHRTTGLFVLLVALALTTSVAAQAPPLLFTWGSFGSGDGEFIEPRGLAVDASGSVYVTDYFLNSRIQVFDANGVFARKWGWVGTGPAQFVAPEAIAIDGSGNIYVTDSDHENVQKFAPDTTFIRQWGAYGTGDGEFTGASGIAVDAGNNVYVLDDCRVQKFTSDGIFLHKWQVCTPGSGLGTRAIAVEPSGTILVGILGHHPSIQRYSPAGISLGEVTRDVYEPYSLATDPSGRIYVADGTGARVLAFTSAGALIASWGSLGSGPGQFQVATGIALGPGGEIYVSDRLNVRIQKYGSLPTPTLRSSWGRLKTAYR